MECEGLETLCIKDQTLTNESMLYFINIQTRWFASFSMFYFNLLIYLFCIAGAEKVVGWALSHHLMQNPEADPDARLVLSSER